MENVKVSFTNKLGQTTIVTMPVNQYVASNEALPAQYKLYIDPDLSAVGAIDSQKILDEYLASIEPKETDVVEADMETIQSLQENQPAANPGLQAQIVTLTQENTDLKAQVASLQNQLSGISQSVNTSQTADAALTAQIAAENPDPDPLPATTS
jgi:septal ring factor EnvC (AmiA/AmiB activator)